MVVYFAVDAQYLSSVGAYQRLPAGGRVDDRKAFMRQNSCPATVNTAPVRPAVTYPFTHFERLFSQGLVLLLDIEYGCYAAHVLCCFKFLKYVYAMLRACVRIRVVVVILFL